MPEPELLPELARSLRTLGAPRDAAGEAAHSAVFVPLLDARARATTGDMEVALSALRAEALGVRIQARVADAAEARERAPARARARGALVRGGHRVLPRRLPSGGRAEAGPGAVPARQLAARAGAKEAACKALAGRALARAAGWRELDAVARREQTPVVVLHGRAAERAS